MAKRKRLSPAAALGDPAPLSAAAPEVKSMGGALPRRTPPIADVAAGAATAAALDEMAERWDAARKEGRLVLELPLAQIELQHLQRDRLAEDPEEAEALRESLRRRGQQTPIEVVALPGRAAYGLLSGWRRCRALKALHEETGEEKFATVLALLRRPEDAPAAYLAMIEENEIRAGLSHYERARIVVLAADRGVFGSDKAALAALFASVPRARRSKIGSFIGIVRALGRALRFPEALSERAGLDLAQHLRDRPGLAQEIAQALAEAAPEDAAAERAVIMECLSRADRRAAEEQTLSRPVETKTPPETLAETPHLRLRRDGARLIIDGPGADADLAADLAAWLAVRAAE
ncbi:ParB N-terminal domain-containing protein [Salipiger sp. P9]|uniref:ParB/RepB/Spo0J family partition protein n=1 Tax=Salipiger pentaromativorans TaxID=2943193 RepID=UPI0021575F78|nr:ParB N-terminal domain-containing protein [Salipiger pentaromativorans]MCR8550905.1 ParB N-terminal domain-containing protein [Salipiger pentaromativorans]